MTVALRKNANVLTIDHGDQPLEFYDYDALGTDLARRVRASVATIHEGNRRVRDSIFTIGVELTELKRVLPHGEFGKVIAAEYGTGYWDTANRCMAVYERLGGDEFRNLRNLRINRTTLYLLAAHSTPQFIRYEVADAIEAGEIKCDRNLDAEIKRRIDDAKRAGVVPQSSADKVRARQVLQRDHAIAAVRILKRCLGDQYKQFLHHYGRAGNAFDQVARARVPEYTIGLVDGELVGNTGLLLTDKELLDYTLHLASTPTPEAK